MVARRTIRIALGSSRKRLIASRTTETLLLVIAGGALSLPLAEIGSKMILRWLVSSRDLQIEVSADWRMIGFTAAVTGVAGVLVGLLPALRGVDLAAPGKLGHRSDTSSIRTRNTTRLSAILVGGQLALSITSLVIAGLLTRTLLNYESLDVGMDRQHVLSIGIDPSAAGYNEAAKANALYRQLTAAIDKIPGVISSAVAGCGLMNNGCATVPATVPGAVPVGVVNVSDERDTGLASELLVGRLAGLFSTLTLPIAAIGLYGIFAYEVTLRRPECGVRLALGATKGAILRLVVQRAALFGMASLAVILPARRAASVDPASILRSE